MISILHVLTKEKKYLHQLFFIADLLTTRAAPLSNTVAMSNERLDASAL
jgi:hypothetical protein